MQIDLVQLLDFYDSNADARRHSNALKTLAGEELNLVLLAHYLRSQNWGVTRLQSACTAPKKRLDAWILVQREKCEAIHYQVEVKSWSFHGFGGGVPLPASANEEQVRAFKMNEWRGYWDLEAQHFRDPKLNKVLTRMRQFPNENVKPLACLWACVHPTGGNEPFFHVPCAEGEECHFNGVDVFSASSYVRSLIGTRQNTLILEMPDAAARLGHIRSIFGEGTQ